MVDSSPIIIESNKNATAYIALNNDQKDIVRKRLKKYNWILVNDSNFAILDGTDQKELDVFSKKINSGDNITLDRAKVIKDVPFVIMIKEGTFCLINFFVYRRIIIPLYIYSYYRQNCLSDHTFQMNQRMQYQRQRRYQQRQ